MISLALVVLLAADPTVQREPKSVYRVHWIADTAVTAVATAGVITTYDLSSALIRPRCPCPLGEIPFFDRWSVSFHSEEAEIASDLGVGLAVLGPVLFDLFDVGPSMPLLEDGMVFAEVLAASGALVTTFKYIVQRPLPLVYSGSDAALVTSPRGYRSFYSGHTALATGALTALAMTELYRHGPSWVPWAIAGGGGALIGVLRVAAGRHFPSDVLVGFVMGAGAGIAIPALHRAGGEQWFGALPLPGGMVASWAAKF